jgi:hypothetical protein
MINLVTPKSNGVAKKVDAAINLLEDHLNEWKKLTGDQLESIIEQLATKQEELDSLQAALDEKRRVATVNTNLEILQDKEKAMTDIAKSLGLMVIKQEEYDKLEKGFLLLQEELELCESTAAKEAEKKAFAALKANEAALQARFDVDNADIKAENKTLKLQITALENQLTALQNQLNTALENVVKVAQAAGSPSITVESSSKR